jgi:hypothetical protein
LVKSLQRECRDYAGSSPANDTKFASTAETD